jgi:hypothetical protein
MTPAQIRAALAWEGVNPGQFYVYLHARPDGSVFYVGKGKGKRVYDFRNNRNPHYLRTVDRAGKENVLVTIFPCDDEPDSFYVETIVIDLLRKRGDRLCNLTDGGDGVRGYVMTDEVRAKMSAARKGKPLTLEHRQKMSEAHKGRKFSEETRKKISEALTGKDRSRFFTPEVIANMTAAAQTRAPSPTRNSSISAALKGKKLSDEHRASLSRAHQGLPWSEARRAAFERKKNGN